MTGPGRAGYGTAGYGVAGLGKEGEELVKLLALPYFSVQKGKMSIVDFWVPSAV